ncbi:RagB/SusD family nutrient uptake outer membrane protein [Sphingobacterium hungaricum]|uniref:SusD-like N-terminal domain-containing protein n=1 Tax=Sphingobacterium hungaricum TaxID=2082723 RepID=A0A928YS69_9SPHI|nr:RagB/SusD family nutrient uptake outer membrane protein [Sphingobacterium hungaricum]MBE8713968.1 hypothetical protein [Sphingobacterium hungaricum]
MKKILFIITLIICCSCDKYLDVQPSNVAYEPDLFSTRSGFEAALANVYFGLTSTDLYGREMKYGFVETLVGYYKITSTSHELYEASQYNYLHSKVNPFLTNFWNESYNLINQCNIILQNLDNIKDDPYYNIIKGETLGLRSLIHFELLKYFGPCISVEGLSATAISYRDKVDYVATKFSSAQEFIDFLIRDLEEAELALQNDPVITNSRSANLNTNQYEQYNSLIDKRGERINYYGVKAMRAMVYQWKGDASKAGEIAEEIIAELKLSPTFRLTIDSDLNNPTGLNVDIKMNMENLFGLYIRDLKTKATYYLPELATSVLESNYYIYPDPNLGSSLYTEAPHGSTNDYRFGKWFGYNLAQWRFIKYDTSSLPVNNTEYSNFYEIKMITLHQVYMIACESLVDTNLQKSIDYFNEVRVARSLTALSSTGMTSDTLKEYLFKEVRKESIGDGNLFTTYKRMFRNIDREINVNASLSIFKFPIPTEELTYNPN